jgi:hypothetical protein
MRLVVLESPYAGDVQRNEEYARCCLRDSLHRGEAPIASHLLYTQPGVLRDDVPEEREQGIKAGLAWADLADAMVVYTDFGISKGMAVAVAFATERNVPVEYRSLEKPSA